MKAVEAPGAKREGYALKTEPDIDPGIDPGIDHESLAKALMGLAVRAGAYIMTVYESDFAVTQKSDESPVTAADEGAEKLILAGLHELAPAIPVISEEAASQGHLPAIAKRFFLVDPLDGTKEFISRNGEFTVNIALIENGVPVIGVVYAPALARLFYGFGKNQAFEVNAAPDDIRKDEVIEKAKPKKIAARVAQADGLVVVASRSHRDSQTDDYLKSFTVKEFKSAGSSLKFCLVATGEADFYPRLGRTMEWDTAAGHAVLSAAGGEVTTLAGAPFIYGKVQDGFANPFFIATGATGAKAAK